MVPQIFNLRQNLLISIVREIKFITNRKYAFYCICYVRLSPENISLILWIKIDHALLLMIMIDSCGTVNCISVYTLHISTRMNIACIVIDCPMYAILVVNHIAHREIENVR